MSANHGREDEARRRDELRRAREAAGAAKRGVCPFCGAPSGSREHVIPEWYSSAVNPHGHDVFPSLGQRGRFVPKIDLTTKRVCHDCNTVWLNHQFEARAAPLIKNMVRGHLRGPDVSTDSRFRDRSEFEQIPLASTDRELLAAWAYKTMLTAELTRTGEHDGRIDFREDEYRRFRVQGTLPPGASMVLGWYSSGALLFHFSRLFLLKRSDPPVRPAVRLWTLLLRPLLFQFMLLGDEAGTWSHVEAASPTLRRKLILLDPDLPFPLSGPGIPRLSLSPALGFADPSQWPPPMGLVAGTDYDQFIHGPFPDGTQRFAHGRTGELRPNGGENS